MDKRITIRALALALLARSMLWAGAEQDRAILAVSPATRTLLRSALGWNDPVLRAEALQALARLEDREATDTIRAMVHDREPVVRAAALDTLARLVEPVEVVAAARRACADSSDQVARRALALLARLAEPAAGRALAAVGGGLRASLRRPWADAMASRPEPPPAELVRQMAADSDPLLRVAAARIVTRHQQLLDVETRLALASDRHHAVRAFAVLSLAGDLKRPGIRSRLLAALKDRSPWVRRSALQVLRAAPPDLERVAPLLNDGDPTVRQAAIRTAAAIGSREVVKRLVACLGDREVLVAEVAGDQLAAISGPAVQDALAGALDSDQDQVAAQAARALGLARRPDALPALRRHAAHRSAMVRQQVYRAMGLIGDRDVVPLLLERVSEEQNWPRAAINEALGRLGDRRAVPHLIADCHYPDKRSKGLDPSLFRPNSEPPAYTEEQTAVATAAVRSLGQIGDRAAVKTLVEVARDLLRNEQFWTAVAHSLKQLGDQRAEPALITLGTDGFIVQGMAVIELPDSTRCEALEAIAALQLRQLVPRILNMDPTRCSQLVRRAGAAALTSLTGQPYRYSPLVRVPLLFLRSRDIATELAKFQRPLFYLPDSQQPPGR